MEEIKKQNSSKVYIGALIITISLIVIGISVSYAYFANRVSEVNPENKGVTISSGALTMNLATENPITAPASTLIDDTTDGIIDNNKIKASANYTKFTVTLPAEAKVNSATYSLYLTDIKMTSNFKSKYLKWALFEGETSTPTATGDFSGVTLSENADTNGYHTVSNISLKSPITISKGANDTAKVDSYKLYIWLSNDPDNNQTSLLEGKFSAKVGFRATTG